MTPRKNQHRQKYTWLNLTLLAVFAFAFGPAKLSFGQPREQNLSFAEDNAGNFTFNTGVVKGTLQKNGPGQGIRSLQFIGDDAPCDANHGLVVPYRFLTPQKRYGFGSWEWPRTGQLGADGSAELHWPSATDHPFDFSLHYQWKTPDTLDVTIEFTPRTDLQKFELFLGSYLTNSIFTKAGAYVKNAGNGRPGFISAPNDKGYVQFFPKNSAALSIVNDGRWKFPPYPMDWRIRNTLEAPLGIKRAPKTGATVLFMSPPQDCFAVSMWQQLAKQGGLYQSLFGRDIAAGQKAVAHVRLVFGKNINDTQAVQRYTAYLAEIQNTLDPSALAQTQKEPDQKPSWLSPEIPQPKPDGSITLFDGKYLYGCNTNDPIFTSGKVTLKNDTLQLDDARIWFTAKTHNATLRVRGKKISGRNITLSIGQYRGWFNGTHVCFGIHKTKNDQIIAELATVKAPKLTDFFDMEMKAIDGKITLLANGVAVASAPADPLDDNSSLSLWAVDGTSLIQKIEATGIQFPPKPSP